jgi:hypothetical protein
MQAGGGVQLACQLLRHYKGGLINYEDLATEIRCCKDARCLDAVNNPLVE